MRERRSEWWGVHAGSGCHSRLSLAFSRTRLPRPHCFALRLPTSHQPAGVWRSRYRRPAQPAESCPLMSRRKRASPGVVSESSAGRPSPTSCRPLLLLPVPDTDGDEPNTRRATDTRRHRARIRWRTRTEEFPSGTAALSRKRGGGGRLSLTSLRRRIIAKLVTEVSTSMTSCDEFRHSVAEVTTVDRLAKRPSSVYVFLVVL